MRPRVIPMIVAVGVLFSIARPRLARADEALRIEQAVQAALENNERSKKTPLRVDQAEGALDKARTAFFPTLTAGGSDAYKIAADKTGRHATVGGTLTLSQPIVSPSAFPSYSQASHQLESERWGSVQDRRSLMFDTARAFLQALAAEKVLEAARSRLDRAKDNLANAEARAAAGLASTNDATRASLELTTSQTAVATAEGRMNTAYLNLGFLTGKRIAPPKQGEPAVLAPPERTTQQAQGFDRNPDDQVKQALDRRPDLKSAHEKTAALRASAKEPYYRLIPTLSAQGQVRANPDPLPTERGLDETITLNLTWNVFDNGTRYADMKTRGAQAESAALDESLLRRTVDNDIRVALASLQSARDAFKIADSAIAIAQKSSDETEILYKQGLAKAIELSDATAQVFDSQVTRASAKLTMQQAYLELRFALGMAPFDDAGAAK